MPTGHGLINTNRPQALHPAGGTQTARLQHAILWPGSVCVSVCVFVTPNSFKSCSNCEVQQRRDQTMSVCVCVCLRGGWRHIIEEGLYGSAGGSERRAPVLQRMTLEVSALAPSVYATLT